MIGYKFTKYIPEPFSKSTFDNLLKMFLQLLNITSGDVSEALQYMNQLDNKYDLTSDEYGMGNFINDLKEQGYIKEDDNNNLSLIPTVKSEQSVRKSSLEEIFRKLKRGAIGNHNTTFTGNGDEPNADRKKFVFGDSTENIDITSSIRNAHINHGFDKFLITEDDLELEERDYKTQTSTVLMIDISHSMILYGEDRITPAKKVAMALCEMIKEQYKKDTVDIVVFGNDAWEISLNELMYLEVGPYHTNTYAGLELAIDILRKKKNRNKQIFMITDGKPSCMKIGAKLYKNSFGLDKKIVNKTLDQAARCKRLGIPVTTFMIASDPYLQKFVREFTQVNNGRAYFSGLGGLGEFIFEDYVRNRRKRVK